MTTKPRYFDPNFYYHVYNCGVEKRQVFLHGTDYQRFLDTIAYYLHDQILSYVQFHDLNGEAKEAYLQPNPKGPETLRVKIAAYCLMPNHFHLLIKPTKDGGITRFASDIANSYTKYFNIRSGRVGNLFQGPFQAKKIADDASFLQLSRYIHLNPPNPHAFPYSSYRCWLDPNSIKDTDIVDREEVSNWLEVAGGPERYKDFVDSKIRENPALGIENLIVE